MKFLEQFQKLVHKPPKVEPEIFLSLILDESYIQAAAWELGADKKPHIIDATSERAPAPSWEDRIRMADHAIGKLEEKTGSTKLTKVVLGLGERFLTKDGDIEKSVRPELKKLTKSLALTPLGFVPLSTSIAHFLRKTEGIPTSVILIGATERNFDISIYRVGRLAFSISVPKTEAEGEDIENGLKACTDADVLPSRILLYGSDDVRIQETQSLLLRHQWTARANFLHYPKIELFPFEQMIETVVRAGANEITHELQEELLPDGIPLKEKEGNTITEEHDEKKEAVQTIEPMTEEPHLMKPEEKGSTHMVVVQPEVLGFHETTDEENIQPGFHTGEEIEEGKVPEENPLEFDVGEKENLLEKEEQSSLEKNTLDVVSEKKSILPSFSFPSGFSHSMRFGGKVFRMIPKKMTAIILFSLVILIGGFIAVTRYLPRVTVTLAVLPKTIATEDTIIIDPQATVIDMEKKIIPAQKLEKVVTGEKTVPATGKKKIGDPAKGTATLYNKSEGTSYTLKKGTVITTGSLQFTLDGDVSVASAATNLSKDQLVFGKASVTVTAIAVGPEGNIDANKEFTVKDHSSTVLVARNDQPFTGGTSKDVTVVSRADTDTLLKALTADLVEKAKTELTQSVSGKDRMIDQTVKTVVKEKQFIEEIDQEAKDLHGNLTVSVSAYTYNEEDIKTLLSASAQSSIPEGYSVNPGRTTVSIGTVTIAKDGRMTAKATLSSGAIPTIDEIAVKKTIAGKKLVDATNALKMINGVASAEFIFQSTWKKDILPMYPDHITISVLTVE